TSQYGYGILSLREKCARMFITFMEVFDDMCNLSDGVYLDGIEKGKAEGLLQGEARGIEKGRFELIKKFIQKGHSFESALDMFDITDKKEVEALKNAIKA
ncbi:MAG: hypothetical protein Q4A45_06440, partial [Clostridia bacterium]|nr:hypothetical protein [Clostridia bacterium]